MEKFLFFILLMISMVAMSQNTVINKNFDDNDFLHSNDIDSTLHMITPYFSGLASEKNYELLFGANFKKEFQNKNTFFKIWTKPEFLFFSLYDYLDQYDSISRFPGGEKIYNGHYSWNAPIELTMNVKNHYFLSAGYSKFHWGDGYRGLNLSYASANYPYLLQQFKIKGLEFSWAIMKWTNPLNETKFSKYSIFHSFSFNIGQKWRFAFFENLIYPARDSAHNNFEFVYLLPHIFYRYVDYSLGSPYNLFFGGNFNWRAGKNFQIYGQAILDDFIFSEFRKDIKHILHPNDSTIVYGNWMNKYAVQIGFKWRTNNNNFRSRLEFNAARPYTYSHKNPIQNFSNNGQPVAHPFGANFYEALFEASLIKKNWQFYFISFYKHIGYDSTGTHFGQNIFQPTFDAYTGNNIPVKPFYNVIGQGNVERLIATQINIMYKYKINYVDVIYFGCGLEYRYSINGDYNELIPFIRIQFNINNMHAWHSYN